MADSVPQHPTLRCVTCRHPLPEEEEHPEYFAQTLTWDSPEHEPERAVDDVDTCLRYAQTVNNAIWAALLVRTSSRKIRRTRVSTSRAPAL